MSAGQRSSEDEVSDGASGSYAFRPNRRTVLAAAAWTVPAIIVGTAAPALAAASDPISIGNWGPLCKHTGSDGDPNFPSGVYHIPSTWLSSFNSDKKVTVKSVAVGDKVYTSGITVVVDGVPTSSATFTIVPFVQTAVIVHCVRTVAERSPTIVVTYDVKSLDDSLVGTYSSGPVGSQNLPTCPSNIVN